MIFPTACAIIVSKGGDFSMGFFGEIDAATNLFEKTKRFYNHKDKFEKQCEDYYFEEFNKKIFIKKNGDGIIVSSFILKVIDPSKISYLVRTLDISDAKFSTKFPAFNLMETCSVDNVFQDYGFWVLSDNNIVTDVEEFYEEFNIMKKNDNKFISIKLNLDSASLIRGKSYKFAYAFSVPGLFPIKNGRFDDDEADRAQYETFNSYVSTKDIGHHLRFSAYFENGIDFKEKPVGLAVRHKAKGKKIKETKYPCQYKNNIFYEKYCFEVDSPQEYEYIRLKWNLKNRS